MEKEYIEELLKDIDKSSSLDEKTHLLTVFITELAKSDNDSKQVISEIKDTLILNTEAFKSLTKSLSITSNKFYEMEEHLLTMSNQLLSTAESMTQRTEEMVKFYDMIGGIYESLSKINKGLSWITNRIDKLSDK